jgi:hypothetical protein
MRHLSTLSVALTVFGVVVVAVGATTVSYLTISNTGSVKTIGVGAYWDSTCTSGVSSIPWGAIEPGSTKNVTVYIKNQGTASATLSLATGNWNPTGASSYISLSWNYGGQSLSPGQVLQVKLILSISSAITGISSFSFDITISATG